MPVLEALRDENLRRQWTAMHEASDLAHSMLHPNDVQAAFEGNSSNDSCDVIAQIVLRGDRLSCLGVLDPWDLSVFGPLRWKRSGRRLYAKSLLAQDDDASSQWLNALCAPGNRYMIDALYIEALDRRGVLCERLRNAPSQLVWHEPEPPQPRWRINLPATVDEYWQQQFSAKSRSTLRRKKKKLSNSRVTVTQTADDIEPFLRAASEISQATWQTKVLGLRVRNDEREQRLYKSMISRGAFRGYLLEVDSRPAAFVFVTLHNGTARYEETGYVPELSDFSPGLVLVSEVIDDLIAAEQCQRLDFGLGHAAYKEFFANDQSESEDIWLLKRSTRTALERSLIQGTTRLRHVARKSLDRAGLLRKLRRWSRG